MKDISHLLAMPWLLDARVANIFTRQYHDPQFTFTDYNSLESRNKIPSIAGVKATRIGTSIWNTGMFKHSSGLNVAIVPVLGTLTKRGDLCSYGTRDFINEIDELNSDNRIAAIVLDIEGPGGTVDGINELALTIKSSKKPVVVFGDCMVASAHYWIASQSRFIVGNESNPTEFGSIGVLCVHEYWGKFIEKNIGSIRIIRATQSVDKARVNAFERLRPEDEKKLQETLKSTAYRFISAVKIGRGSRLKGNSSVWGTGKMFNVDEAIRIGLIDAKGSLLDAIDKAAELA